jgi:hypothetical protein
MHLVERSLGPSGSIWHPQRQQQQAGQNAETLVAHLTSETRPNGLAYNVGELAKLGQFDAALKLIEELGRQSNSSEALEM